MQPPKPRELTDFVPKFHDREAELINQRDAYRAQAEKLSEALNRMATSPAELRMGDFNWKGIAQDALEQYEKFKKEQS